MPITKKEYNAIAKSFKVTRDQIHSNKDIQLALLDDAIEIMAAHLSLMNEKFDQDTFMQVADYKIEHKLEALNEIFNED